MTREAKNRASVPSRELYRQIYAVVRQVPAGQVATYGQIALVADVPSARIVGQALSALEGGSDVPWHRIVNSQGKISVRRHGAADAAQMRRLTAEGVFFDRLGRVDFQTVAWPGPGWAWLEAQGRDLDDLILRSSALRRKGAWCRWRF